MLGAYSLRSRRPIDTIDIDIIANVSNNIYAIDYVTGIGNYVIIALDDHYGSEAGEYSLGSENASSQLSTHIVHTFVAIWSGNVHSD